MTRFTRLAGLLAPLFVACSAPAPAPVSLQLVSDSGRVDADVEVVTPVVRGSNELFVQLTTREGAIAKLTAVDAAMVAHGHRSHAANIEHADGLFHVNSLDLFMTGRWLIELELEVDGEPDHASLPVDVP